MQHIAQTPTAYFKKIPALRRPDEGCALSCMHASQECSGSRCAIPRRECIELCKHTERRVVLQARKDSEPPRLVQVHAECEIDRHTQCKTSGSASGSTSVSTTGDEECKWLTNARCLGLKILWQDRPGTNGEWEVNGHGDEAWVTLPAQNGVKCSSVGEFHDYCRDYTANS